MYEWNFATSLRIGTNIRIHLQPWLNNSNGTIRLIRVIRSSFSYLYYQHRVPISKEPVFLCDGFLVGFHEQVVASEGGHLHHHRGFRQVEVGNHAVGHREGIGWEDELVGPAFVRLDFSADGHGSLKGLQ